MRSPNITILQYQILENLYLQKTDFEKNTYFYKAVDKLKQNNLIKKRPLILTEDGEKLTEFVYKFRNSEKNYRGDILDLDIHKYDFNGFCFNNFVADFDYESVVKILKKYKKKNKYSVLDPFCGTGITNIACQNLGFESIGFDINPLMVFKTKVKANLDIPIWQIVENYEELVLKFLNIKNNDKKFIFKNSNLFGMNRKELDKWLSPVNQKDLASLWFVISKIKSKKIKNLFEMISLESAVSVSNARFCPGITFYANENKKVLIKEFKKNIEIYLANLSKVSCKNSKAIIKRGSAFDKKSYLKFNNKVDLIVTSPPYPNNIDYVLFSKLELFLSGFVKNNNGLKLLRKKMISSNPKLSFAKAQIDEEVVNMPQISNACSLISAQLKHKKWGFNYDLMLEVYFSQMKQVLINLKNVLTKKGKCILVLGDQNILGIKIETAKIVGEIAKHIGFRQFIIENYKKNEKVLILRK